MNTHADNQSRRDDGMVAVVGMLILLLGTATGNAITLLVMSVVGFVGVAISRQRWGRTTVLVMTVSAAVAAVTAIAISILNW